ncbi:Subunit of the anaphase-promoting complex/cyclosome (APC/C) [Komagataella phaffii GS115]|uniref:Subunit of the anaphase-promoting complex/cyclosome (APC/C) n=2 Tax=Komagataella phaffii TaxID=460519 RepID=C4QXQ7_KOMPG|nr:Subunit of the anaphase-promoting complex/cyclosome (APC/C) [Komagataella phaffii GS115]CAY68030.1 Subunit of the anaphase-promoting complex/cyclosome (APC/C) [Komagataella phaffii GS115]
MSHNHSQHNSSMMTISPSMSHKRAVLTPNNSSKVTGRPMGNNGGSVSNKAFSTPKFDPNNGFNPEIDEGVSFLGTSGGVAGAPGVSTTKKPLSLADKLRLWRHDALMQHHYNTAQYIGDKVLSITNDPNDAFWLAQVHYQQGSFLTARNLLRGDQFEDSLSCKYLCGLCLIALEEWDEALDVVGEFNPYKMDEDVTDAVDFEDVDIDNYTDGGIKLEASMCYLRGKIYMNMNNFDRAKDCFREAVLADFKCYEAFDELITNNYLSPQDEWELLEQINFDQADELVKLLYSTRLNKLAHSSKFLENEQKLQDEYNLKGNNDLNLAKAELLFLQCKFDTCLTVCETILKDNQFSFNTLPLYLSCLYELDAKNKLFLVSHQLAEYHPNHYITWLSIGIYYISIKKINESRIFFSKSTMLAPNFAPAWIGFAHTFAIEGEHEQAISAYSTAVRLFPGSYLPYLFLGMQYLQMNNLTLAYEYLSNSMLICDRDPLLLNELGIIYYHRGELSKAEHMFNRSLEQAHNLKIDSKLYYSIYSNLAHVNRKLGNFQTALEYFENVRKIDSKDSNIYASMGLIYLKMNKIDQAIQTLHIALSISPNDTISSELLNKALSLNMTIGYENLLNQDVDALVRRLHEGSDEEDEGFADD